MIVIILNVIIMGYRHVTYIDTFLSAVSNSIPMYIYIYKYNVIIYNYIEYSVFYSNPIAQDLLVNNNQISIVINFQYYIYISICLLNITKQM